MVGKTRGSARVSHIVAGNAQAYTVWCESPNAFSDPEYATGINIRATGDIVDETQKNFEVMIQSIGLRAMPIILDEPEAVSNLENKGASAVNGEGFVWSFSVEQEDVFASDDNPVGLLIAEINGIVLPNGVVLYTSGPKQNIEFMRRDKLNVS